MKKTIWVAALVAVVTSLSTALIFDYSGMIRPVVKVEQVSGVPAHSVLYSKNENGEVIPLDFTATSEQVMNAVVFIKSSHQLSRNEMGRNGTPNLPDPFREFFQDRGFSPFFQQPPMEGGQPPVEMGAGSGVIINEKGYIITNNHVIDHADEIEITLHDNRTFKASVVGADPATDLALLQIRAEGLPTLPLANSDEAKVGQWVLAVGNPFNLNSTVTAGIISAKGRNINLLKDQYAVESFLQTDAAINPGNSGGALVNLDGQLLGINTAIASPTGAYSGYGFAVPSNIVAKVVKDLLAYGSVQRGYLGAMIRDVSGPLAKDKGLALTEGVYVDSLLNNSAAAKAGLQAGDIITSVDGNTVRNAPQLQEAIARHNPGDEVRLAVDRKGQSKAFTVKLQSRDGEEGLAEAHQSALLNHLGAEFQELAAENARKLGIEGGVKVTRLFAGKLRSQTDIREGFIVTKADGQVVRSPRELEKALSGKKGGVLLEGIYEDVPGVYYYAFGMDS
ncbi:MAG: Do family serine endopeptidase [Lewinellaceae bacterium]|nr:Do family serine endopeptidase [Phaeodactylibacter sp.]MCB9346059.1 Do family serine endopeptidase [Lewinellaceae bacterium]